MEERLEQATKLVEEMEKESSLNKVEEMIKDNKIMFKHEEKYYRVRLLNLKEKEELDQLRRKKFGQLIQDKDILLEAALIKVLKTRDIDIDQIDSDIKKLDVEDLDIQLQLGEAIHNNEGETIFKRYEEQISEIRIKKAILSTRKNLLLEFSLENQLLNYVSQIITYLSLDIQNEDETWNRMFKKLDDFQIYNDESLINKAGQYSMLLQYS
jgi:hypothetical protein